MKPYFAFSIFGMPHHRFNRFWSWVGTNKTKTKYWEVSAQCLLNGSIPGIFIKEYNDENLVFNLYTRNLANTITGRKIIPSDSLQITGRNYNKKRFISTLVSIL